ncbi:MAG: FG-GAP-like repeat-containing protein, partial [Candidatus Buchananbacteria bacterium]
MKNISVLICFLLLTFLVAPVTVKAADSVKPEVRIFNWRGILQKSFTVFGDGYAGSIDLAAAKGGQENPIIIVSAGGGNQPLVEAYNADGIKQYEFLAYGDNFRGGVYVSAADLDADGHIETVTGAGYGGGPHVRVFRGDQPQNSFFPFNSDDRKGVRVLAADLGRDNQSEILAFSNYNTSAEVLFLGNDGHQIRSVKPNWLADYFSGLKAAVGDFNGDGAKEIALAGGSGNAAEVYIFDQENKIVSIIAIGDANYHGGFNLAAGDVNGDGKDELAVGLSFNGSDWVSIYDFSGKRLSDFMAYSSEGFDRGVKVAMTDTNNDGIAEIITVPERVGELKSRSYKFITVDLIKQVLTYWQDGQRLGDFLISSGKASTPTPTGEYNIYLKRPKVTMSWYYGPSNPWNYILPNVPWVSSLKGPYTIHG